MLSDQSYQSEKAGATAMHDWSSGYVTDIAYTYGYYPELNPLRGWFAFLNAGLSFPEISTACELGFGQGVSVNIHAAASPTAWYGTDFNPAQAVFAQTLTAISQSNARLFDDSFAEFVSRSDLPEFDFIGIHGIWSWISDKNRAAMVDFLRTKLRVGGIVYMSYNTQPGWAVMSPIRHLLTEHASLMDGCGLCITNRIESALGFTDRLMATAPLYMRANPQVEEKF